MAVVPSTAIGVDSEPSPSDLAMLGSLLRPNWRQGVVTRTAFMSEVSAARSDSEHRRLFYGKPTHSVEALVTASAVGELASLRSNLLRASKSRNLVPLYSDETVASAIAGTVVTCDTTYRRFFLGARVALLSFDEKSFEVRTIVGKTDTSLTLNSSSAFGEGTRVFPLIESKATLSSKGSILTDMVVEASVIADELPGKWALDPVQSFGSSPSGFNTYLGFPILDTPVNFRDGIDFTIERTGDYSNSGISQVPTLDGGRGRVGYTFNYLFSSRAEAWKMLRFFESRGGRTLPFWVASPTSDFEVVSIAGTEVQVKAAGPVSDWDSIGYLALSQQDGSVIVRSIAGYSRSGDIDTLTLDNEFGHSSIERLSVARLSRFANDEFVESWSNLEVCEASVDVIELTREQEVEIANLSEATTTPMTEEFNPFLSGGTSGVAAPMFFLPCQAPNNRPAGRAADLLMPQTIEVEVLDEFSEDSTFPIESGSVSAELLAALPGTYRCGYLGTSNGPSGHWHHITACRLPPSFVLGFCQASDELTVTRHVWRATKTYAGGTITVDFVAEWSSNGAAGALFNIYVYSDEVNSDYEDGDPFSSRNDRAFTRNNPAVWGSLAGGQPEDKFCHPQMLICASVPTSWTAPCGNQGFACDDTLVLQGFKDCIVAENGAPWVGNDVYVCEGNVVHADGDGLTSRAMSLGGGCPQSELFDHIIIENGGSDGVTALVPSRSGWNEDLGSLDALGGSSIRVRACAPSQAEQRVSCCEGREGAAPNNPDCWRPGSDAPNLCDPADPDRPTFKCCFSTESVVTLRVTQKCLCRTLHYDGDCIHTGPNCPDENPVGICGTLSKEYILPVCEATFGDSERSLTWATHVPDPTYIYKNHTDDFDDVDPLAWGPVEGTWLYNDSDDGLLRATTAGSDTLTPLANVMGSDVYRNLSAEIECLTDGRHGIAMRSVSILEVSGYAAIADTAAGTLKIVFIDRDDDSITTLAETTGLSISAPFVLRVSAQGNRISAQIDDNPLAVVGADDCRLKDQGYLALFSYTENSEFDNFEVTDGDFTKIKVTVSYSDDGWVIDVPKGAMPYDQDAPNSCKTSNPDCGVSECGCTRIERGAVPESIIAYQSSDPSRLVLPDDPKPWSGSGGFDCEADCVGCNGKSTCATFADFRSATVRVSGVCSSGPCPDGSKSQCAGVDLWHGQCNPT